MRRLIIKSGAAAAIAAMVGRPAMGTEMSSGPLIWRNMDQRQLDDAYTQASYTPNIGQVIARWNSWSDEVRARIGPPLRFEYGNRSCESMDVYTCKRPNAPIHVFIHGGAWKQSRAKTYGFAAELFIDAGVHYVVPDFSWVQDEEGNLFTLADQLRRSLVWIHDNASEFGGDAGRIFLSGHSSGGHLAGVLLTTDWQKGYGLPRDLIKGGLCCSGMFDLEPVRLSHRGNYIRFTDEMEYLLSPIRHLNLLNAPLIVVYGTNETPEFQRQSRAFANAASALGKTVKLIAAKNYNHFEIMETLANPYGICGRAALELLQET